MLYGFDFEPVFVAEKKYKEISIYSVFDILEVAQERKREKVS